jgi:hypothetical protein
MKTTLHKVVFVCFNGDNSHMDNTRVRGGVSSGLITRISSSNFHKQPLDLESTPGVTLFL